MKKALIALMLGGLGIGMTEFVMMGILPVVAQYFHVSIPQARNFITFYAIGVVVGAPSLMLIAGRFSPKKLLLFLALLFTVFNGLSAFAPSYTALVIMRFLAGLPHGAFFGVASIVASRIAQPGKEARAIAMVFTGLTIANVVAVPLGTFVGFHVSWRLTFLIVMVIGFITFLTIAAWVPNLAPRGAQNIRDMLHLFKQGKAWLIMAIICTGTAGLFAWFSYIAPLLTHVSHFAPSSIAYIMIIAGLGMVVGNLIGGKLSDHTTPLKATIITLCSMVAVLSLVHFFSFSQPVALVLTFIAGANSLAMAAPIQMLMIGCFRQSELLTSALSPACFNVGNALGAGLGGLPIAAGLGYTSPELVGVVVSIMSLVLIAIFLVSKRWYQQRALGVINPRDFLGVLLIFLQ